MINQKLIDSITEQMAPLLAGKLPVNDEALKQPLKSAVANVVSKLDLVSRDEFEAQKAVLMRTREKVEALEQALEALAESPSEQKADQ